MTAPSTVSVRAVRGRCGGGGERAGNAKAPHHRGEAPLRRCGCPGRGRRRGRRRVGRVPERWPGRGPDRGRTGQTALFLSRRRSRSERPPQMPKRSSLARRTPGTRSGPHRRGRPSWPRGWSRPSPGRRTRGRSGRTARAPASRVPLPLRCRHRSTAQRARSCGAPPLPLLASPWLPLPRAADDTSEITVASLWPSQAELWYWGQDSLPGTKPLRIVYITGHIGPVA